MIVAQAASKLEIKSSGIHLQVLQVLASGQMLWGGILCFLPLAPKYRILI
jgi:hypothetical protein